MQTRGESFPGRRLFLKQAMAMGGTGVLVLLATGVEGTEPTRPDGNVVAANRTQQGYRLTDHIRTYYDTTRS